ncbi:MAG: hypothetical protein AAF591_20715 [Verrucomicrobiota bacterium]
MKKQRRNRSWLVRLAAVLGCVLILAAAITAAFVGFTIKIGLAILAGLSLVSGPAIAEGGGLVEVLGSVVEIVFDAFVSILEGIGSVFSGF